MTDTAPGTFEVWECPTCNAAWVYRRTSDGRAALDIARAEHKCLGGEKAIT